MNRELLLIVLAMAIAGSLVYFGLPALGYSLKYWALIGFSAASAVYAGVIVLLGETLIEDLVKLVLFLAIAGGLWYSAPRAGFIFVCVLAAGVVGLVVNQASHAMGEKKGGK